MVAFALDQLRMRLSECSFQVLYLRLVEQWPVAEVAEKLGLRPEQVWCRYHRARRMLEETGSTLTHGQRSRRLVADPSQEKKEKNQESVQGKAKFSVPRDRGPSGLASQGGTCR